MELTLDQALQRGIEAHKTGQLKEAERLYTAVLKAQPKHPDANHNMGVLAVGVGKVHDALPFFKTALEANPNVAQYWLSYIDALIKLDRVADAKVVFDQAKALAYCVFEIKACKILVTLPGDREPGVPPTCQEGVYGRATRVTSKHTGDCEFVVGLDEREISHYQLIYLRFTFPEFRKDFF